MRGIAVLAVVLFHLGVPYFDGGFVGVDIFFVISGYLITSHLLKAMAEGTFRFHSFYRRRILRLLPALLVTLSGCLVLGFLAFPTANFEKLDADTLQALFSVANIGYWLESGYFDTSGQLKPLLHTWSLSVEEQFYLVWPALMLCLGRRRGNWAFILLLGAASLGAAEYWLMKDPSMVFYLMPFRVAEFSLGALLFWFEDYKGKHRGLNELLVVAGLALTLLPVLLYDESTVFPGLNAIIPCLGAACLIHAGGQARLGRMLQARWLLFLGLISYSLYLVHWPLLVFYKYTNSPDLLFGEQAMLFLASVAGAWLMYACVETPFRGRARGFSLSPRFIAGSLAAGVLGLSVLGLNIGLGVDFPWKGQPGQWSQKEIQAGKDRRYSLLNDMCALRGWDSCQEAGPRKQNNVLILSDSHAVDALNIFSQAFPEYHYVMYTLPGGCPPIVKGDTSILSPMMAGRAECIAFNKTIFTPGLLKHFSTVIISVFFQWYTPEHLAHAVDRIGALSDAEVIVLGNYISLDRNMSDLYNQGRDPLLEPEFVESFALFEHELRALSRGRFTFISKKKLFCTGDSIAGCKIFFGDAPFSYDMHHLSLEASLYASRKLRQRVDEGLVELPL